jgi:hypothetical protein
MFANRTRPFTGTSAGGTVAVFATTSMPLPGATPVGGLGKTVTTAAALSRAGLCTTTSTPRPGPTRNTLSSSSPWSNRAVSLRVPLGTRSGPTTAPGLAAAATVRPSIATSADRLERPWTT